MTQSSMNQQILMGVLVVLLSMIGLQFTPRFLAASHMGRKLTERLGEPKALRIARAILLVSLAFGTCLATGIINPR